MKNKFIYAVILTLAFIGTPFAFAAAKNLPISPCEVFLFPDINNYDVKGQFAQEAFELAKLEMLPGERKIQHGKIEERGIDLIVEIISIGTVNLIKHTRVEKTLPRGKGFYTFDKYFIDLSRAKLDDVKKFFEAVGKETADTSGFENVVAKFYEDSHMILKDADGDSAKQLFRFFESIERLSPPKGENISFGKFAPWDFMLTFTKKGSVAITTSPNMIYTLKNAGGRTKILDVERHKHDDLLQREYVMVYDFQGALIKQIRTVDFENNSETTRYEADFTGVKDLKTIVQLGVVIKRFSHGTHNIIARKENAIVSMENAFFQKTMRRIALFLLQ